MKSDNKDNIGMLKKEILNPYTKQKMEKKLDESCKKINNVGILICTDSDNKMKQKRIIIFNICIIFIIGFFFALNIKIYIMTTSFFVSSQSLFTVVPSYVYIMGCIFISDIIYMYHKKNKI